MKIVLAACVALLALDVVSAQQAKKPAAAPPFSVERPGDGLPKCGLGKSFHAGRRAALRKALGSGVVVVRGLGEPRDYFPFRQDKVFWYLTGIESPDAALVMDCASGRETLFLPPQDKGTESWNGELWDASDEWVKELTGFAEVRPMSEFEGTIGEWVKQQSGLAEAASTNEPDGKNGEPAKKRAALWVSMHPSVALAGCWDSAAPADRAMRRDPFDGRESREEALKDALTAKFSPPNGDVAAALEDVRRAALKKFDVKERDLVPALNELKVALLGKSAVEVADLTLTLNELRRVKTSEEIDAMRRAGRSGADAMSEAMRSTSPELGEWDLDGLMSWLHVREGAAGPAYHAIVGSGANSLVLHYGASNRRMKDGEILLIDYAPEVDHYTCDITRTWPVNGHFSARQAELYDAVLEAQLAGIAAVKPGVVIRDVERACSEVIKKRGFSDLVRHGACHFIGMEVHDVGDYAAKLEPGVCFTVEPGLYEQATGIGIRIEDVVCVTADGCEVLSAGVPKDRPTIEKLVQEVGVLDWLSRREQ